MVNSAHIYNKSLEAYNMTFICNALSHTFIMHMYIASLSMREYHHSKFTPKYPINEPTTSLAIHEKI